jgi:thiol-disulfide isomerase/thioredoxin
LRSYAGHPLWVNFFATWCVPCKAELPEIERRYKTYNGVGLVVLGIDQQESSYAVSAFAKSYGVTYPLAIDQGAAASLFSVHLLPLSMFVDVTGTIRLIRIGQMQPDAMDAALETILGPR